MGSDEVHAASAGPPPASRPRILVIDDEIRVGELLVKLLSLTHDVTHELRAVTAYERIVSGERYDVILCDLMMPDMTGMDLQAKLEADVPELAGRTVFMTGGAFTPRAQAFCERFEGRLLEKPFRMHEVLDAITRSQARAAAARV